MQTDIEMKITEGRGHKKEKQRRKKGSDRDICQSNGAGLIGCDSKHMDNVYGKKDSGRLQLPSSVSSFIRDLTKRDGISKLENERSSCVYIYIYIYTSMFVK